MAHKPGDRAGGLRSRFLTGSFVSTSDFGVTPRLKWRLRELFIIASVALCASVAGALQTVEVAEDPAERTEQLRSFADYTAATWRAGEREEAQALIDELIAFLREFGNENDPTAANVVGTVDAIGAECSSLVLQEEARRWLARHVAAVQPDQPLLQLGALQNLSNVVDRLGRTREAHELNLKILAGREALLPQDDYYVQTAKLAVARTLRQQGEVRESARLARAVHDRWQGRMAISSPDLRMAKTLLANALRELGDVESGLSLFAEVFEGLAADLPEDHVEVIGAKLNVAVAYGELGEFEHARELLSEVLDVVRDRLPPHHELQLLTRQALARTLGLLNDVDGTHALNVELEEATRDWPRDHPQRTTARFNLAHTLRLRGELERSYALALEAEAAYAAILPADDPVRFKARLFLVEHLVASGDADQACARIDACLQSIHDRLRHVASVEPRAAREICAVERSRAQRLFAIARHTDCDQHGFFELAETLRQAANLPFVASSSESSELRDARLRCATASRAVSDAVTAGPAAPDLLADWQANMRALVRERDSAQRDYLERLPERQRRPALTRSALAEKLDPGELLIGYMRHIAWTRDSDGTGRRGPDRIAAQVLDARGRVRTVDLGPADRIMALVEAWRGHLHGAGDARGVELGSVPEPAPDQELASGSALREAILDPLLAGHEPESIYVALDDALHLVPIDALPYTAEERVGDRILVRNEVSFGRLLEQVDEDLGGSVLLCGDPDFDLDLEGSAGVIGPTLAALERAGTFGRWQELPGTRREIAGIADIYRKVFDDEPVTLTGAAATRDAFFAHVSGRAFVHIATHGWFADERLRALGEMDTDPTIAVSVEHTIKGFAPLALCGLSLAGANGSSQRGVVTAEEVASLDLAQCDLAVLSACETNVGLRRAGLGIVSLQSALHAAGARTAITSLWKVEDDATEKLMTRFYTYLWQDGLGKAEALWKAKSTLRAAGLPPRAWAAWVLTGDPE